MRHLLLLCCVVAVHTGTAVAARWTDAGNGLTGSSYPGVRALAIDRAGSTLYAVSGGQGVFKSSDGGSTWQPRGAISGVLTIAIDPASPSTVYAGTPRGVRKSQDGGENWTTAGLAGKIVSVLAVDPVTSSTVYAASSDKTYKTIDGGVTWTPLDLQSSSGFGPWINVIAVDPINPSSVYAAGTGSPLYKSTDGGASWSVVNAGHFFSWLRIAESNPYVLYAIRSETGVSRSIDGGATWAPIGIGIPIMTIVTDPSNASTLYAALAGPNLTAQAIYKSTDGGDSWFPVNTTIPVVSALVVNPGDSSVVYAISYQGVLFRSGDAGRTWSDGGVGIRVLDLKVLSTDPANPGTIYAGGGAGLFKSLDRGANWNPVAAFQVGMGTPLPGLPLPVTPLPSAGPATVASFFVSPADPATLYAGTHRADGCFFSDQNYYKSTDGGATWSNSISPQSSGCMSDGSLIMDPGDPNTLYLPLGDVFDGYWLTKSSDAGATWGYAHLAEPVYSLIFDPRNSANLYAATYAGVLRSKDGAATWSAPALAEANVTLLAIDPRHPDVLYAASTRGLFKSVDGGDTWSPAGDGLADALAGSSPTALLINPAQTDVLYLATSGYGVFKSPDGGRTWTAYNDGLPYFDVRTLAFLRDDSTTLFAATPGGVFKLVEDGQ
jgi:photosystem II stability/assembly factor-like uncharacterized protein